MTYRISSDSLSTTEKLAVRLGRRLRGGELFALSSDLGGGKTTFTRGLAAGMGSRDHVASPTFTLSRTYGSEAGLTMYHFDFYRLQEPGIMTYELAEVIDDPQAVVVVEWGEIVADVLPERRVDIVISAPSEDSRMFVMKYPPSLDYLFADEAGEAA